MLQEILKYVTGAVVGAGIVLIVSSGNSPLFAGYTTFSGINTTDGYQVDGTSVIDGSGNISGAITGAITSTTGNFSSTLNAEGLTTISGATSTLKIGNNASGIAAGCLVLGDSGGATSTPVYITATGATITATTTKPATCQ
jgi:hypothetical protein